MIDFKSIIAKNIVSIFNELNENELLEFIEVPKDKTMGDFALPCFKLAKSLKKSPQVIAEELYSKLVDNLDSNFSKIENVGGYLNFFVNSEVLVKDTFESFDEIINKEEDNNKTVVIDYSSPNIAKPFHVGHLRSTVIGGALYRIYSFLGYNVIGINHLGDYGTQFGKLIEGFKRWGNEYNLEEKPIDQLTKIYVRINELCKEDESVLEECRNNFKRLEENEPYYVEIWEKMRKLSLNEFKKVYDVLGSRFDSNNGEAFYSDKMNEVVELLEKSGQLHESQGAMVVDVDNGDSAPCIIIKSNGSTTYETRDLAAILYRARTYDYDKALYVTAYDQTLHFHQVFETSKYLGLDEKYTNGLIHVPFGMVLFNSEKMATREGNVIKLQELIEEAISRTRKIIEEKNPDLEDKEDVAKKVGVGAIIFNDLSNSRIKDENFKWETMLNFQGETGPYIQYIFVRTKSILEKAGTDFDKFEMKDVDYSLLTDKESINVIKELTGFKEAVRNASEQNEPSIVSRYLIDLAQSFSSFYNENKIICDDEKLQNARLGLTYMVGRVLRTGANLLGIQMPDRM